MLAVERPWGEGAAVVDEGEWWGRWWVVGRGVGCTWSCWMLAAALYMQSNCLPSAHRGASIQIQQQELACPMPRTHPRRKRLQGRRWG